MSNFVTLSPFEIRIARELAEERREYNEAVRRVDHQQSVRHSSSEIEFRGIAGELAFCRLLNVYPDLQSQSLEAEDAIIPVGNAPSLRVDVKTTTNDSRTLWVYRGKRSKPADCYALMLSEVSAPRFELVGFIMARDVFVKENERKMERGICYRIPRSMLVPLNRLVFTADPDMAAWLKKMSERRFG